MKPEAAAVAKYHAVKAEARARARAAAERGYCERLGICLAELQALRDCERRGERCLWLGAPYAPR